MRERNLKPMERNWANRVKILKEDDVKNVKKVISMLDHMIAGKRFGELDSAKQMYLLDCQAKISDMENGIFTEASLGFLRASIDELIKICVEAKNEIDKVAEKL